MAKAKTMRVVCGLDVGNGYVKGKASVDGGEPRRLDMPSAVSYTVASNLPKDPTKEYMGRLLNELDCDFQSRGIRAADQGRVYFGERAVRTGESLVEFNIENHVPKCLESLSTQLVLGSVAACALQARFEATGALECDELDVECVLGVALPIEDYLEWRERYASTLKGEPHYVHVHNFERDVCVRVTFAEVTVLAEGAAAQYAIGALGAERLQMALDIARAQGAAVDAAYDGAMLVGARNTIGIDIGEGTTNFPVFANGDISIESSQSINRGYGSVLTAVAAETRNSAFAFESRKDLGEFLLREDLMPAQRAVKGRVQALVDDQVRVFCREIMKTYTNIFRKVGLRTDVVYVYGGGANAVREALYPMLVEASSLDDGQVLPIIYMDSAYSRDLNRDGLYQVADLTAQVAWQ